MIKAIFFDLDGVLTLSQNGTKQTCDNLARLTGLNADILFGCHYKLGLPLLEGKETYTEFWPKFEQCVNQKMGRQVRIDKRHLKAALKTVPKNERMFDLATLLKTKNGFKLGIISDNSKERFDVLKKELELYNIFDIMIVSSEVKALKSSKRIFEIALASAGVKPEEAVIIDDNKENLIVPEKMGFKTIHYDHKLGGVFPLIMALNRLGVDIKKQKEPYRGWL
jgi:putative hydrolase of the HAD superfamily